MKRRAPESGYIGGVKAQYRRNIWAEFRRASDRQGWSRAESHVLLMPSAEGKEIEVTESAGFRRDHMHVVDDNPAIVAHLQRRFPGIQTYGCSLARAGERIAARGIRLRFSNCDLTGPPSAKLQRELVSFTSSGCLETLSYVAVTMLRGREQPNYRDWMDRANSRSPLALDRWRSKYQTVLGDLSRADCERLSFAGVSLSYGLTWMRTYLLRAERYRSTAGVQTMLWGLWQVFGKPDCTEFRFLPDIFAEMRAEMPR